MKDSPNEAKRYALKLISIRPRSRRELQERLLRRGYRDATIGQVIQDLSEIGLINDAALTEQLISYGLRDKGLGIRGLKEMLYKRGIDRDLIENAGLEDIDEYPHALKIAEKLKKRSSHIPADRLKRRITGYLQRRGYSYDTIREVLRRIGDPSSGNEKMSETDEI